MITINILEKTSTLEDMVYALRQIADLIEQGYTSGYHPTWDISGKEVEDIQTPNI